MPRSIALSGVGIATDWPEHIWQDPGSYRRLDEPRKFAPKEPEARDVMSVARRVVEDAIGGKLDGSPLAKEPPDTRNPAAVVVRKHGASKGGKTTAKSLSASKRKEIAKRAAKLVGRVQLWARRRAIAFKRDEWFICGRRTTTTSVFDTQAS
jgi:hypothetical protein